MIVTMTVSREREANPHGTVLSSHYGLKRGEMLIVFTPVLQGSRTATPANCLEAAGAQNETHGHEVPSR